jgi:pimeloyl-ACP methyl ester carboxylesterase
VVTPSLVRLDSGAEGRLRNPGGDLAAVLVNGGTAKPSPGTWSATSELLAEGLAPRFPRVRFLEVRYRVKTWKAMESCVDDAAAAVENVAPERPGSTLLIGFSMGGAVAISIAGDTRVAAVLGLAPWIPGPLSVEGLRGKRLDVLHGGWDRYLPGVPGVSPAVSRAGFDRALQAGSQGSYTLIARGLHGAALRRRSGALVRLPCWREWLEHTAAGLDRFVSGASA